MDKHEVLEHLHMVRFFHDVDAVQLEKIADIAKVVFYQDNDIVFREGGPPGHVFFLVAGGVSLEMCAPGIGCKKVLTVGPGEILGWSAVLEQTRLTATARATSPTSMVQVHAGLLLSMCDHNPQFGYEIMRRTALALAKRLSATRIQLLDLYGGFAVARPEVPTTGVEHAR